jgi:hypothetical protein
MSRLAADFERAFDHCRGPARRKGTEPSVEYPQYASYSDDLSLHGSLRNSKRFFNHLPSEFSRVGRQ